MSDKHPFVCSVDNICVQCEISVWVCVWGGGDHSPRRSLSSGLWQVTRIESLQADIRDKLLLKA